MNIINIHESFQKEKEIMRFSIYVEEISLSYNICELQITRKSFEKSDFWNFEKISSSCRRYFLKPLF